MFSEHRQRATGLSHALAPGGRHPAAPVAGGVLDVARGDAYTSHYGRHYDLAWPRGHGAPQWRRA